jgi:DNA-binding winged helix-turn-helix (wHTH) protein/Tfp pilus assembly protein PilF
VSPNPRGANHFMLGEWSVDPARAVIIARDGSETRLEPQVMDLLVLFAGSPGEVLSKDRIIANVWKGRAIGDDTLAAAISRLRSALGSTRFIETIPKRGYRLVIAPDQGAVGRLREPKSGVDSLIAQGFAILKSPTPMTLDQANLYFESAIKADARQADAYAGLAQASLLQHLIGSEASGALVEAAQSAARAAFALDAHNGLALAVLGYATLLIERDFAAADGWFQKAIAGNPQSTVAHRYRGLALAAAGRFVEAEREARAAMLRDPVSLSVRAELLQYLLLARRYVPAIAEAKATLAVSPLSRDAWSAKGWAHYLLGEEREAKDAFLQSLKIWGLDQPALDRLGNVHESSGMRAFCAAAADIFENQRIGFIPRPTDIAIMRVCATQDGAALIALNKAATANDPFLLWVLQLPQFDRLRNDPRFVALVERVRPVH